MKLNKGIPHCIEFDTKEMPGKVVGVRVELSTTIIKKSDRVNIALCDHPLYPKLEKYVLNNPSQRLPAKPPGS